MALGLNMVLYRSLRDAFGKPDRCLRGSGNFRPHAALVPCASGGCENTPQAVCVKSTSVVKLTPLLKMTLSHLKHLFSHRSIKVVNSNSPNDLGQVSYLTMRICTKKRREDRKFKTRSAGRRGESAELALKVELKECTTVGFEPRP